MVRAMASNKCPHCGVVNWIDAEVCKRCKASLIQVKEAPGATPTVESRDIGAALSVCGICGNASSLSASGFPRGGWLGGGRVPSAKHQAPAPQ